MTNNISLDKIQLKLQKKTNCIQGEIKDNWKSV